ncbi:MAG: ABC transporter substrate-binding protein [Clostridia bacterium]|nr:ABC transporter substrate-binding protein [Clostridia bacterium]
MKKFLKTGLVLAAAALLTVSAITGCDGGAGTSASDSSSASSSSSSSSSDVGVDGVSTATSYDAETRPFTMAISTIDGNFNPFFYTSNNDGTVISMTQVSMLSTDKNGNIVCGENYPTVVKDYTMVSYDEEGNVMSQDVATSSNTEYTEYSFLIKNGMKFSDGYDLTVMDVLFSLYVNIDTAYTGSATLYSNDIQGLKAYRAQDPTLDDDSTNSITETFNTEGQQRLNDIIDYCNGETVNNEEQVLADIETVKELFLEEVTSDWTTAEETFGSRDKDTFEYSFTETWQYYYLQEGVIEVVYEKNENGASVEKKDGDGKYVTTLNDETSYAEDIADAKADTQAIQAYIDKGYTEKNAIECVVRDFCINYVWETMTGGYGSANTNKTDLKKICQYWGTASNAVTEFASEARSAYFASLKKDDGSLQVETISGVTVERVSSFNGTDLGADYDVLKIRINGVDPKALYNFAFTVCPLHYYSGTWTDPETNVTKDYVAAAEADYAAYKTAYEKGDKYTLTEFGVEYGRSDFYSSVVQATAKNGLPVGAGPYKASDSSGGDGTKDTFWTNKTVYYVRNTNFYTTGTGIHNAIIKYVRYIEMSDNSVVNALTTNNVDYGTPSATTTNKQELNRYSSLDSSTLYDTSGYGYVGVNPKYVPDVEIRQAIMMAMNTSLPTTLYYSTAYSQTIYRPMSKTSWAYPENCTAYYKYTTSVSTITELVESAGYKLGSDGIYTNGTTTCKFTFTIAGDTTDHPAYDMFTQAEEILEQCGFDITVKTDTTALNKLTTGNLEVWAAAWTSAVDPDMYQVYHMDSTASSVNNWNYSEILANPTKWSYEYNIIVKLSDVIDKARETNLQSSRKAYYSTALDYVMELAVELPTYQRKDNEVFNQVVINKSTLNLDYSCYASLVDRIWEIDYN